MMRFSNLAIFGLCMSVLGLLVQSNFPADFAALFFAAQSHAMGIDAVYAPLEAVFSLQAPDQWDALKQAAGVPADKHAYPYIYPPIWVVLFAPITELASAQTIFWLTHWINAGLATGIGALAWKICASRIAFAHWMIAFTGFFILSTTGMRGLEQGQIQILVSFLILLCFALVNQRPWLAGIALGVAIALKLSPILFIVLLIAQNRLRSVAACALTLATLSLISVVYVPLQMHQTFFAHLHTISNGTLVTHLNASLTSLMGIFQGMPMEHLGTMAVPTEPVFQWINKVALLAALAVLALMAYRRTPPEILLPCAAMWLTFFSPLAWSFHYLTLAGFVPLLLNLGKLRGSVWIAVLAGAGSMYMLLVLSSFVASTYVFMLLTTASVLALWIAIDISVRAAGRAQA